MSFAKLQPIAAHVSEELETLLAESLSSVEERERSTLGCILADHRGRCVLFGAGSLGRAALRRLSRDGIRPLAFTDNNSHLWHSTVEGLPVLSPADVVATYGRDSAFFVTIWTTGHRYAETYAKLTSLGAQSVYPAASIRWKYAADLLPSYCQDLPRKVYEEADAVRACYSLWSDDPIPGENPSGRSLRLDPVYDRIREARREDDSLAQGAWQRERKVADHGLAVRLMEQALATESKDLQLAAWLSDSLLRREGIDGLRNGLKLCEALVERSGTPCIPRSKTGMRRRAWRRSRSTRCIPAIATLCDPTRKTAGRPSAMRSRPSDRKRRPPAAPSRAGCRVPKR